MLNKEEITVLKNIKANPYMRKTVALVEKFVEKHASKNKKAAYYVNGNL